MAGKRRGPSMIIDGLDHIDCRSEGIEHNKSTALEHIHSYYKKALDRLPPDLIPSLLEAGFCFGFLDPVSNIIANTVSQEQAKSKLKRPRRVCTTTKTKESSESEKRRIRHKTMSKIIAESSKDFFSIPQHSDSSIAARSFSGLATFLTSYFRYLTIKDALRYLRLSKADLLVAVRLIEEDHSTYTFTICNITAKIALGCAAISAMHPGVPTFVSRSLVLASRVDEVSNLLPTRGCIGHSTIKRLSELFIPAKDTKEPRRPMQHAISRMQPRKVKTIPVGLENSLKRVLLDKIHVLYLEAISRMPKHDLCSRLHVGLLKAGHCYGPSDPVTNIILNTIWYVTRFPAEREFEVEMICTKRLAHIECLSLDGLVAYIRVCFPALSAYEAMRYLLINNAELDRVIKMAKEDGHGRNFHFSQCDAYGTASREACHPSPTALVEFATTVMPVIRETLRSTIGVKRMLSSSDVRSISETLSQNFPFCNSSKPVPELNMHASEFISEKRKKFESCQRATVKRVKAALLRYAQEKGQEYELHVICDVNAEISGKLPEDYIPDGYKCPFSHINILAKRKGSQIADAGAVPTLLFIECSNIEEDMQAMTSSCYPILEPSEDAGRCFHCECKGIKVIHPPSETYLGRCTEFEEMARGENTLKNDTLVYKGKFGTLFVDTLEDDCVYFDPAWDADFSAFINQSAISMEQERDEGLDLFAMKGEVDFSWLKEKVQQDLLAYQKGLIIS